MNDAKRDIGPSQLRVEAVTCAHEGQCQRDAPAVLPKVGQQAAQRGGIRALGLNGGGPVGDGGSGGAGVGEVAHRQNDQVTRRLCAHRLTAGRILA